MQLLINRFREGDSLAFNEIFDQFWEKLYLAALKKTGDEHVAQDIVQEIFIGLWDRREVINLDAETIEAYLFKSVKNKVINHFISSKGKPVGLESITGEPEEISPVLFSQRRYEELESLIKEEVEKLPGNMKTIFQMRDDKLSIKQIALNLNLAEQTVKNQITEALKILRKKIKDTAEFSNDQF